MIVHVYPADLAACGNYRLIWPARALAAEGHDVTVFDPGPMPWAKVGRRFGEVVVEVSFPQCDVVVLQRPMSAAYPPIIRKLRSMGVRVVVDIDDDLDSIDARHPAWNISPSALHESCRAADVVTVTTPALLDRYGYGHGVIIPNCVPERYLAIGVLKVDQPVVVGCTISTASHPGDLDVMRGAVANARRASGFEFRCIGNAEGYRRALGIEPTVTPRVPIEDFPEHVAQFDIGLAPLQPSAFNEAKSWLRPLEMAALGVPFIASPTSPYRALGHGLLAEHPRQWEGALKYLARDESARIDMANAGRAIAARLTIEGNTDAWRSTWMPTASFSSPSPSRSRPPISATIGTTTA